MAIVFKFLKSMLKMPNHWLIWIGILLCLNFILPLLYLHSFEAKIIILCLMAGAMIQTFIFSKLGFVRLLGLGHMVWIPMLYWLFLRIKDIPSDTSFYKLVLAIFVCNGISLIIDFTDIARYIKGERQPTV